MHRVQAKIETHPEEHTTAHVDCTNAFPSVDRLAMLSVVYEDQRLSNSWHVFNFAYGNTSSLIIRDHAHVMHIIPSDRGVKQSG